MQDLRELTKQIKGCQYVVHIAANTSQKLLKLEDYYETNVLGTQNVIDACIENHVKKLVYIGTANTYGYGSISNPGNEEQPMKSPFTKSLYALSKNQAQRIIDKAATRLNITTISPTFMLGANDTKPSSGRIILMALNKRFVFYPSGGKNFVHVSDVADAIIKALSLKQSGQKYILANENLSYKDFFRKVVSLNNQITTLIPIPDFILRFIGLIGNFIRMLGIKTDISSTNAKVLTINNFYSNKKVKQEFEIKFTPINKAIVDSLEYFCKR
ncbi:MAG: NAD-dependent epimerase/dehydratase family protein [Bacteroidales bacterium]|nr:NAD-dependent epimerase/dehydratase family protein [Bacteroidales bacterium]